ncbi:MAG TPA: DUF6599 family protein [Thermoanaerobaculia bacterium]
MAAPPPPRIQENFASIDSPSLQFIPRGQEAPGWKLEEDPIVVPGDRLPSFLGADARNFTRYEALDLTVGKYAGVNNQGFATVEIFRYPDFVKSFGSYSMRKKPNVQFIANVENEAFQAKHSVHLWRGPFYVRITGGSPDGAALQRLAASVAERMPAAPAKPAVFNFFPTDVRVPNSERYSAEQGFGQVILANSFQASFNMGGDIMEGVIIPASNKATATRILESYRALYVRNGKLLDAIPNLGEDNFTAEDRYLGRAVAFRIDRFVIAFNGFKDRQKLVDLAIATDTRILGSIRKQLVTAEKQAEAAADPDRKPNSNVPPWQRQGQ